MAFDKIIVNSLTGVAKNGIKMDLTLDTIKERLINSISTDIDQLNLQLPFNTRTTLTSGDLPSDLLSPSTINSAPTIPTTQKSQINDIINNIENNLNLVITQKNNLQGALNTITTPLITLENLSNVVSNIVEGLNITTTIIKTIPIPTSVPPGIGIPVSVINVFSDALDKLSTIITKFSGPIEILPDIINQINNILIPLTEKFQTFNPVFSKTIDIISFIRLLLSLPKGGTAYQWDGVNWNPTTRPNTPPQNSTFGLFGNPNGFIIGEFPNQYYFDDNSSGGDDNLIQQSDIDDALLTITSNIQQSLVVTSPNNSNSNINAIKDQALLDSLDPKSNNPLSYKGFRLILEFDPNNTFSFPARRIKGYNSPGGVTLYSVPPDQGTGEINTDSKYSFSTSVEVLVEEVKFQIDNYFLSLSRKDVITPKIDKIKRQRRKASDELSKLKESRAYFLSTLGDDEDGEYDLKDYLEETYGNDIKRKQKEINQLQEELEYWKIQLLSQQKQLK